MNAVKLNEYLITKDAPRFTLDDLDYVEDGVFIECDPIDTAFSIAGAFSQNYKTMLTGYQRWHHCKSFAIAYSGINTHKIIMLRDVLAGCSSLDLVNASLSSSKKARKFIDLVREGVRAENFFDVLLRDNAADKVAEFLLARSDSAFGTIERAPAPVARALSLIDDAITVQVMAALAAAQTTPAIDEEFACSLAFLNREDNSPDAVERLITEGFLSGINLASANYPIGGVCCTASYVIGGISDADTSAAKTEAEFIHRLDSILEVTAHNEMAHFVNLYRQAYRISRLNRSELPTALATLILGDGLFFFLR